MDISISQAQGSVPITIIKVDGQLDGQSYQTMIARARELYEAGARDFILDLSDLTPHQQRRAGGHPQHCPARDGRPYPNPFFRLVTVMLLCTEGFLILLYLNHLCKTSWISLKKIDSGKGWRIALAFLVSVLLLPGLITFAPLFTKNIAFFAAFLALSSGAGVVFERILFFRFEQPDYFLSRS